MRTSSVTSPLAELSARLPELMLRDQHRIARRLDGMRRNRKSGGPAREEALASISAEIDSAALRIERRRAAVPKIKYPAELPVGQRKDEILEAIRDHQVVILAGETGSGKTTQLPKICLELGRGVHGLIGHTQPRRLAARTVAERIAEELHTELGQAVGYAVRFTDRVGEDTLVKLMTDGILLAEIQRDRMLRQYDTIIIDEAHERSLNIDFLLGYLKELLPRRPDLKVIITSATIDPERFSRHFGDAPMIEVSGRTYPVEVRYRPIVTDEVERDQVQAICDAVDELAGEAPGDVLVFLSGEREIRDTADALVKQDLRNTEVVPLYARLSAREQHRVFQPHTGRRIVLATNVAETSLTVPGIKYVIDPGTARISRYSLRTKVQRLPIEAISQASANQRSGRCGRLSAGVCIRLYSEQDYLARPEFTDPEILRTHLASVILQMSALGLGDVAAFPFVDPPDRRNISDGVQLLHELGALNPDEPDLRKRLTPLGRSLAQLPVDPRLGRMVLEAQRNGCLHEVMVIAAALSIQDPRERPEDKQQAAAEQHARFVDKNSDFISYLNLWEYLQEQQKESSSSRFRRMCRAEYLNYLRVREWQDVYGQLRQVARTLGSAPGDDRTDPDRVHQSLLAGLLSQVGLKDTDKNEYLGARNAKFAVFPGSALFKKPPRWVMAAELVETSRLWGRIAGRVEPEWIEKAAGHLVRRSYSEPHWEKKQAAVIAFERVTLYGIPLVAGRKVNFGRIDPETSRDLFIRHALVEGDWETRHRFFHENRELLAEVEDLEHRARRRDIMVDDETLFEFYDQRIPADVVSGRHFDSWWKKARHDDPALLTFEKSMLVNDQAAGIGEADYPDVWSQGDLRLRLTYQFEPGTDADGVTVHIPLAVLNQVTETGFDWQIPGLRAELVESLLRSLPKTLRRHVVPVPDCAAALLHRMTPGSAPLLDAVEDGLRRQVGIVVPRDAWQLDRIPDHLRITFRIVDERQQRLAEGRDLARLRDELRPRLRETLTASAQGVEKTGLRDWTIGDLTKTHRRKQGGYLVTSYPALVDEGDDVAVRLFDSEAEQRHAMWAGTRRLVLLGAPAPIKLIQGRLSNQTKLALTHNPHGGVGALLADCASCAADRLIVKHGGPAWTSEKFATLRTQVRAELPPLMTDVVTKVEAILTEWRSVELRFKEVARHAPAASTADIRTQLGDLVFPGFVTSVGYQRLPHVLRYLRGIDRRLEKLPENPGRDQDWTAKVAAVTQAYQRLADRVPSTVTPSKGLREVRWAIEELRLSYFAQNIKTAFPISDKRIMKALEQLES
ncbi:ATP-dependent RNA helicase HrpA [Actinoalloteichus hymeniacidonis]|uniref:ATP-dependent RNA helicase HrpA n=1 Tax=Actinoalloteichus hymeniacidonis TaxID=340345 RepID=UPI0009FC2D5D|nr:ATP-dependent RNA helicase HrpA [Actinoalloteichus hymeniacidonis]MBB5908897.1 ATP-dependent helicase HrpA [Actinoalloteichus hymeniacidonis]